MKGSARFSFTVASSTGRSIWTRIAALEEFEQLDILVERVERAFDARLDREAGQVGSRPGQAQDGFVALRILQLLETAQDLGAAFGPESIAFRPVALAAGGEADQLDRAAGQGARDVAAESRTPGF